MSKPIDWSELEIKIQSGAKNKDGSFKLYGPWKRFAFQQEGFYVFAVDGEWVRTNLSIIFGHGGHGLVHEFVPHDEIWIDIKHHDCKCENVQPGQEMSLAYFKSTAAHEIKEFQIMSAGTPFNIAHKQALEYEKTLELLVDPFTEIGAPYPTAHEIYFQKLSETTIKRSQDARQGYSI